MTNPWEPFEFDAEAYSVIMTHALREPTYLTYQRTRLGLIWRFMDTTDRSPYVLASFDCTKKHGVIKVKDAHGKQIYETEVRSWR